MSPNAFLLSWMHSWHAKVSSAAWRIIRSRAYGRDLGRFREFLVTQGLERWEHLEAAHIRRFVEELERLNLAPRSRSRSLVSVRRLLEFACAEGLPLAGVSGGVASPGLPLVAAEGAAP